MNKYNNIDRDFLFDDEITTYFYNEHNIIVTMLGAGEGVPCGAIVEIVENSANTDTEHKKINKIYNYLIDCGAVENVDLYDETIFVSCVRTLKAVSFSDYSNPENTAEILAQVENMLLS